MSYVKWGGKNKDKPSVYKSERVKTFKTVGYETIETENVKSRYLGTYRSYREERPNGTFKSIVKSETRLNWMAKHPERLNILNSIDEEVYREFERTRRKEYE